MSLDEATFTSNSSGFGGGLFVEGSTGAAIDGCTLTGNSAGSGGGFHNKSSGQVTLENCLFTANGAGEGAGMFNAGLGMLDLLACTFTSNDGGFGAGGGLYCAAGSTTVAGCAMSGNAAIDGGAIFNAGSLTILGSDLERNSAFKGGAILSYGALDMHDTLVMTNLARDFGGGVSGAGTIEIDSSSFIDNSVYAGDGGAISSTGPLTVSACCIAGNDALLHGGAIRSSGPQALTNCTISDNSTGYLEGGAIYFEGSSPVTWSYVTMVGNTPAMETSGAVDGWVGAFTLANCIVSNGAAADILVTYVDGGSNIVEDGVGLTEPTSMSGDPGVLPLADNGGPTMTHALARGSVAIDAGNCALGSILVDQRGVARPQGSSCDIGAFEHEPSPCPSDFNGDGSVDGGDLGILLSQWGLPGAADLDGNGTVDGADLGLLLGAWGACRL
jgi:hypothetical protein